MAQRGTPSGTYERLMAGLSAEADFDRHVFACAITIALAEPGDDIPLSTPPGRRLALGLGLAAEDLAALLGRYFPHAPDLLSGLSAQDDLGQPQSLEEPDLRAMLIDGGTLGRLEERWLAHMVARRSLRTNHLWQDLGLRGRADLGQLLHGNFKPLASLNTRDMKWKKFFYRELCQREGIVICKSPVCDACSDFAICFGAEDGVSLLTGAAHPVAAQHLSADHYA